MFFAPRMAYATVVAALVFCGCQHIPPNPLDLEAIQTDFENRPIDLPSIQEYANRLAATQKDTASPFDPTDGLSISEAQAIALWYNTDARLARLRAVQAGEIAGVSGAWADPDLSFGLGEKEVDAGNSVARSWINSAGLSITIPLSGRLRAEKDIRGSSYDVAVQAALEEEWRVAHQVQEEFLRWSATREMVSVLDEHVKVLYELSQLTRSMVATGELSSVNGQFFQLETVRRMAEHDNASAVEQSARASALAVMGLLPDAPVSLVPTLSIGRDISVVTQSVDSDHPSLARARAEYELTENQLRLELRKQYPDLTLSPVFTDEEDETSILLNLGFPIPVWNANKAGIAEAAAARDTARMQVMRVYQELRVQLIRNTLERDGAHAQWTRLTEDAAHVLDQQVHDAQALLHIGEMDVMLLHNILSQALEMKKELLNARLTEQLALLRVSAATNFAPFVKSDSKETTP